MLYVRNILIRTIDREPSIRFDRVLEKNGMKIKRNRRQSNIDRLKQISFNDILYVDHNDRELSPDYP
jgi:hypothetical protein